MAMLDFILNHGMCCFYILENRSQCGVLIVAEAVHVGKAGSIWELSVLPAQFCCEPKTALKNKVYFLYKEQIKSL